MNLSSALPYTIFRIMPIDQVLDQLYVPFDPDSP